MNAQNSTIIKTYKGSQDVALALFQKDAIDMATENYYPTSQSWAPGEWGCGSFLFALLLCIIVIGVLVFFYMLIVKPPGTLTVTYELRQISNEKTCPQCAERIKAAALLCRYCGHKFNPDEVAKEVNKNSLLSDDVDYDDSDDSNRRKTASRSIFVDLLIAFSIIALIWSCFYIMQKSVDRKTTVQSTQTQRK